MNVHNDGPAIAAVAANGVAAAHTTMGLMSQGITFATLLVNLIIALVGLYIIIMRARQGSEKK